MNERTRLLLMVPVLGIAAWLAFFADKTPPGETALVPVRTQGATEAGQVGAATIDAASEASGPAAIGFGREGIRTLLDEDSPNNLFGSGRPPEPEQAQQSNEAAVPTPDFRFIGRMLRDERWNVFLDSGKSTYVVTPGSVINDFRVEAVQSDRIQMTHLPSKTTHIIPIEGDK